MSKKRPLFGLIWAWDVSECGRQGGGLACHSQHVLGASCCVRQGLGRVNRPAASEGAAGHQRNIARED